MTKLDRGQKWVPGNGEASRMIDNVEEYGDLVEWHVKAGRGIRSSSSRIVSFEAWIKRTKAVYEAVDG